MTTIDLPDAGAVIALPDELTPLISYAAGMPIGMYAIIAWAPTGYPLTFGTKWASRDQIAAQRLADRAVERFPSCTVYVTRHSRGAVTVHRPDLVHAGHLIGTALVDDHDAAPTQSGAQQIWQRIISHRAGDDREQRTHDQAVMNALRLAHRLPDGTQDGEVLAEVSTDPCDADVYLRAYLTVLGDPDALRESVRDRAYPTHRPQVAR